MVRAFFLLVLLSCSGTASGTEEAWRTDPTAFINHFATAGIDGILTAKIDEAEKAKRFRALFNDGFDIPAISRFVLARNWRTASNSEQQEFISVFENVIVATWSRRFSEYSGQTIKILGTTPDGDNGSVVDSVIVDTNGQNIAVQWRLRQREDGLRIVDVIVEGVSMAITYRQDYASAIRQQGGLEALLTQLRKQAASAS
ncbi:MAG: ABC transporter substrate-binding protein [Rhodospirillaceae bacterium]|jgi:phospholipid transport system substrate-binding protein